MSASPSSVSRCSTVARRLVASAGVRVQQPGPGEQHDEAREGADRQQVLEEAEQALVGVLGVVDDEHDRVLVVADPAQERRPGGEQVLAREGADGADAEQGARAGARSHARSSGSGT